MIAFVYVECLSQKQVIAVSGWWVESEQSSLRRREQVKSEELYLPYSILVRQEDDQYASWAPELDVASSGKSIEEAVDNLKDAVMCYLDTCVELGELHSLLKQRGLKLLKKGETPQPVCLNSGQIEVASQAAEGAALVSA
jgi:predicted RNase H-like HicB family nuclease